MDFVIGIGNTLRKDDGVAARVISSLPPVPSVAALAVHQLTPELALRLCDASRVLFVDAHCHNHEIAVERIAPAPTPVGSVHALSPQDLLGLIAELCGRAPHGWVLSIPGYDFGFGETLSDRTHAHLPAAISAVVQWMRRKGDEVKMQGGRNEETS